MHLYNYGLVGVLSPKEEMYKYLLFCGRYELSMGAPEHVSATSVVLRARDRHQTPDYLKVFDEADKDKDVDFDDSQMKWSMKSFPDRGTRPVFLIA